MLIRFRICFLRWTNHDKIFETRSNIDMFLRFFLKHLKITHPLHVIYPRFNMQVIHVLLRKLLTVGRLICIHAEKTKLQMWWVFSNVLTWKKKKRKRIIVLIIRVPDRLNRRRFASWLEWYQQAGTTQVHKHQPVQLPGVVASTWCHNLVNVSMLKCHLKSICIGVKTNKEK